MVELKDIFKPEISPVHKVDFSIAAQLNYPEAQANGGFLPAGTLLKGDFLDNPEGANAEVVKVAADIDKIEGVLMHDVTFEPQHHGLASVGVMIKGVVYKDVMAAANTAEVWKANAMAILEDGGISVYGAKTIGKSR